MITHVVAEEVHADFDGMISHNPRIIILNLILTDVSSLRPDAEFIAQRVEKRCQRS